MVAKSFRKTSAENLNYWFETIEETEQIMRDGGICEEVQEVSLFEISKVPRSTTVKVKQDKAIHCPAKHGQNKTGRSQLRITNFKSMYVIAW